MYTHYGFWCFVLPLPPLPGVDLHHPTGTPTYGAAALKETQGLHELYNACLASLSGASCGTPLAVHLTPHMWPVVRRSICNSKLKVLILEHKYDTMLEAEKLWIQSDTMTETGGWRKDLPPISWIPRPTNCIY